MMKGVIMVFLFIGLMFLLFGVSVVASLEILMGGLVVIYGIEALKMRADGSGFFLFLSLIGVCLLEFMRHW